MMLHENPNEKDFPSNCSEMFDPKNQMKLMGSSAGRMNEELEEEDVNFDLMGAASQRTNERGVCYRSKSINQQTSQLELEMLASEGGFDAVFLHKMPHFHPTFS